MKLSVTGECGRLALLWAFRRRLFPAALLRDCTNAMDSVDMEPVGILAPRFDVERNQKRKRSPSNESGDWAGPADDGGWRENDGRDGEPMVKMKKEQFDEMKSMLLDCTKAMQHVTNATIESGGIIENRMNKLLKISKHLQDVAATMD